MARRTARRPFPEARERAAAPRAEIDRLVREVASIVEAIVTAPGSPALAGALASREARLDQARAEIAALAAPPPVATPIVDEGQIRARIAELRADLKRIDSDRGRAALARIFGEITVHPLDGSWAAGWDLKVETRPWEVLPRSRRRLVAGAGFHR